MLSRTTISPEIDAKFYSYDWRNGLTILKAVHPKEWTDVSTVLAEFSLKKSHLIAKGRGNKSEMAGLLDGALYKRGWVEKAFDTKIVVDGVERQRRRTVSIASPGALRWRSSGTTRTRSSIATSITSACSTNSM
ncbi:BglII/BstYI family type II restriction endonuclease [Aestuariivirga sp.]|uniref:BglII/BstYI family type II restriction endonuclease n=1 Tax=Aestuariivirga sp. TaxID=2650926 RepID=UPI0035936476